MNIFQSLYRREYEESRVEDWFGLSVKRVEIAGLWSTKVVRVKVSFRWS
jgi:hypothetical protein